MKNDKPVSIWRYLRILVLIVILSSLGQHLCFAQKHQSNNQKFLIILDVQEYYTLNQMTDSSSLILIHSVNKVIENTDNTQIIYVTRAHQVLNLSFSRPFIYTSQDTLAMRQDKRLNIVNEQIFERENSDAFSCKELTDFLEQNHASEIIIVGLRAEEFLYKSLISGKEFGYEMCMIPEAMAGKSKKRKEKAIEKLENKGIKVLDILSLKHE